MKNLQLFYDVYQSTMATFENVYTIWEYENEFF